MIPAASHLHGTPRCFPRRVPSQSSPPTWNWLALRQCFQGPRPMTAPVPRLGSGTRTSSHHPSILQWNSLNVQDRLTSKQTPLMMMRKTTMTSEQPSLGRRGSWVTPPSALLFYHPSTSQRLRPLAEMEGWAFSQPRILHPLINLQEPGTESRANGVSAGLNEQSLATSWWWWRAMLGNPEASSHSMSCALIPSLRKLLRD